MNTFVLILTFYASTLSTGSNVAITTVPGFTTMRDCHDAGQHAKTTLETPFKSIGFACVQTK